MSSLTAKQKLPTGHFTEVPLHPFQVSCLERLSIFWSRMWAFCASSRTEEFMVWNFTLHGVSSQTLWCDNLGILKDIHKRPSINATIVIECLYFSAHYMNYMCEYGYMCIFINIHSQNHTKLFLFWTTNVCAIFKSEIFTHFKI